MLSNLHNQELFVPLGRNDVSLVFFEKTESQFLPHPSFYHCFLTLVLVQDPFLLIWKTDTKMRVYSANWFEQESQIQELMHVVKALQSI